MPRRSPRATGEAPAWVLDIHRSGLEKNPPMSEVVLILYPVALFGYLMLASRWQPRHPDAPRDERG